VDSIVRNWWTISPDCALRRQSLQVHEASFRPILIPEGNLSKTSLWGGPDFHLQIRNVGNGLATNVQAAILPPIENRNQLPPIFYADISAPIPNGESAKVMFRVGGLMISEEDTISGIPLSVPFERKPEDSFPNPHRTEPRCIARITITATDILGIKHASIFDWSIADRWIAVNTIPKAPMDIGQIDSKNRAHHSW
jgi:hypothetical protein